MTGEYNFDWSELGSSLVELEESAGELSEFADEKEILIKELDEGLQESSEEFWHQVGRFFGRLFDSGCGHDLNLCIIIFYKYFLGSPRCPTPTFPPASWEESRAL